MKNKIKRFLLCFLAVSMATVSGAVKADGEEETAAAVTEEASAEEPAPPEPTKEELLLTEIRDLLKKQ